MRAKCTCGLLLMGILFFVTVSGVSAHRRLLGASPDEVIAQLDAPAAVYVSSSRVADVDAVVFFYADYRYVYFHENRVWQVRLDERSEHGFEGFAVREGDGQEGQEERPVVIPGDSRSQLFDAFGSPVFEDGESLVFELEDDGYPLRLRAFVDDEETIVDLYLYRADF